MNTTNWLATRILEDEIELEAKIEVSLGFPEQLTGGDWRCRYLVKGTGRGQPGEVGGVDALQALTNALEAIATALRESGKKLTWLGGDTGLRRQVPSFLGASFAEHIERVIEEEIAEFIVRKSER